MKVIYHGFDSLEFAVCAQIPENLTETLADAQSRAKSSDQPEIILIGSHTLLVESTGARGGYAFRCEQRNMGHWCFKKPSAYDPWGIRFSASSSALIQHSLEGVRLACADVLHNRGVHASDSDYVPSRIDFAVDIICPGFEPNPDKFVLHSRTAKKTFSEIETNESYQQSNRTTSVTIGRMPRRRLSSMTRRRRRRPSTRRTGPSSGCGAVTSPFPV